MRDMLDKIGPWWQLIALTAYAIILNYGIKREANYVWLCDPKMLHFLLLDIILEIPKIGDSDDNQALPRSLCIPFYY